jgi:hypothetical protein
MSKRWHTYKPFQNWKKNITGFFLVLICHSLFASGDFGLEIDYNKGLPSTVTRKTFIDKDGTVWVGTDAGLGIFPKISAPKAMISKKVGFSQVWDIIQRKDLIYIASYDSGLFIFNINSGELIKRYQYKEFPRIKKLKEINNRLFLIAGNGFFEIFEIQVKCVLNGKDTKSVGINMPVDLFYYNHQYYASFYDKQPLWTWENQKKWEINLKDPLNKFLLQNGQYKTVMTSIVFQNKLYGSTADNSYFSLDAKGKTEIFTFKHKNNDNYVVWDFNTNHNKLILAVGNTNNLESGYLYTHNEYQKTFDISQQPKNPFFWAITYDSLNNGIWANSIKKGVYYFPQFHNNIILPFVAEDYFESQNFQFAWKANELIFKTKQDLNWKTYKTETNIRSVHTYKETIIIHCENGIFIFNAKQKNTTKHLFNLAFQQVFIQNEILYCINHFGPIWSYDLKQEKVINHLDQSIQSINSISSSKLFTILHSDSKGYFIIENDSIYKLTLDIPIDKSKFNFYLAGNAMLIQDGQNLICCEIDFIRKQIRAKEILNLQKLFPTIEINWIKGDEKGLWLGNSNYVLQFGINQNSKYLKFLNQFYLGNSKEINDIRIESTCLYLLRSNFVQKINFLESLKQTQNFNCVFTTYQNISNFKLPYFNQKENFPINLISPNYIHASHTVCEVMLSNDDSILMQHFKETRLPVWMNDINEGLFQISINTINWKKGIPLKIENPILRRTEFWILVLIAVFIFFFFIYNEQFQKFQLQEKIIGLELSRLKSNMNPHFIFNVMNFVQAMIIKNNKPMALKATTKLSQINRLFLETSEKDYVSLEQELEFANTYIQLEKMRFESDKDFVFDLITEEGIQAWNWILPPLILQPLLENALKHGVLLEKKEKGFIGINITNSSPNEIIIQIKNKGLPKEIKRQPGTLNGQKMVIERIGLFNKLYEKTYKINFSTNFEDKFYYCFIMISKIKTN